MPYSRSFMPYSNIALFFILIPTVKISIADSNMDTKYMCKVICISIINIAGGENLGYIIVIRLYSPLTASEASLIEFMGEIVWFI